MSSAHQASGAREALAAPTSDAVALARQTDALARQTDALERISRGESMQSVLTALASAIEENRPGVHSTFLLLDEADGGRLFTIASPSLPASFSDAIDGTAIGPHIGSCGRAAFARHDVVTEDIETDPDWAEWRVLALEHGLRACWSVPVIAPDHDGEAGKVLGTFATYFEANRGPSDDERRDVARTTALATIVLMRNRDEAELRRANLRDPLTGLANRRLFIDELGSALRRARRRRADVTVLFLDIDHFKVLNDSMGHLVGDEVLRVVANRVQQAVRPHDVVARFGGDEFTISCEGLTGAAEAEGLARELRQAIEAPVQVDDREVFLTVSVGIARGAGWESPHDLVGDADAAMYQAKAAGRASVITFDERMREQSRDRLHMESALRRAIEKGELHLVYQPQVDLASGQLVGVEALLRWTSDELGSIAPVEFIPIAEETDLIMGIGEWVLHEACTQAGRWRATQGWSPLLSVNASARQFGHASVFLETVTSALNASRLEPAQLRIEVTESTLGDPVTTGPLVAELSRLGVSLSIDDFGTGFSSLARLRSFPVDELKIDRSFVEGLETHADDRAVVAAIIGMAKALHLDTVGEGVETAGQLDILRTLGCTRVQGYYLGRPIPGDDIRALLASHHAG
ncbi:MAG TPA: EAL domain-containing protein [Acidothermaceae bacterium]